MNFHSSRYASTYGIFNLDVVNVYEIAIDYKIQFYALSRSADTKLYTRYLPSI